MAARKFPRPDASESARREADDLSISSLGKSDLLQAFTLVQFHDAELTLDAWCGRVAADQKISRSHWALVRDRRGYIHAVFRYVTHSRAVLCEQSNVTDLYAAGLVKRYALAAIRAWSPNSASMWTD